MMARLIFQFSLARSVLLLKILEALWRIKSFQFSLARSAPHSCIVVDVGVIYFQFSLARSVRLFCLISASSTPFAGI